MVSLIGETLAHYRIVAKLGEGGMGEVYRAEDTKLEREVALKVLPPGVATEPGRLARFEQEARTLASLDHPNIVHIHSVDSVTPEEGSPIHFLTMQLVEGRTLTELIPEGGVELERFFDLALPLADALATAHEAGVVHRDLKPANVMVTDQGSVKILDFGLAKLEPPTSPQAATELATAPLTREGTILGTVPYMSPEQLEGEDLDARSDIFSFGVLLYEMAMGERPFAGGSSASVIGSILKDSPGEVDRLRPDLPHHLGRIIRRCLEKDPRRRYQTALDVHNELEDLRQELEVGRLVERTGEAAQRQGVAEPAARTELRSGRRLWAAAAAAAAVVALASVWAFWKTNRPVGEPEAEPVAQPAVEAVVPSIAVLPFLDLSPDQDQQYFSDGLSEELLSLLARREGLRVAARTSSFSFRGADVAVGAIADELGVTSVLEGSVRKAGNQVRITAQLINAADGFHLWSESFDRQLEDIFAVQDEIARSVVDALQVALLGDTQDDPPSRSSNVEAYNLYLRGKFFAQRRAGPEDYENAIDCLERAVALDPNYALAWAGLAYAVNNQTGEGFADQDEGHARAVGAVERALELDETLAYGWAVLGEIRLELERDWVAAGDALDRARTLEPNNPDVVRRQAELASATGELETAIELGLLATRLDPLSPLAHGNLAGDYLASGRLDEAEETLKLLDVLEPDVWYGPAWKASLELARGRGDRALEQAEQLTDPQSRDYYRALAYQVQGRAQDARETLESLVAAGMGEDLPMLIAEVYAFLGESDQAFEWLDRAHDQGDPYLYGVLTRPRFANLHDDPRWAEFLARMNLSP